MTKVSTIGRPPRTTREEIGAIALELFERNGFEETTVEQIATAVGVTRRTIFRYFASKNDMVWGDFDWVIARLREAFEREPPEAPLMDALRRAVLASNSYEPAQWPGLRIRMTLITTVPALQAHSALRYAAWRAAVAEMTAERLGAKPTDLAPRALAAAALGASMAAFQQWVENPGDDLEARLEEAYGLLASGFAGPAADEV